MNRSLGISPVSLAFTVEQVKAAAEVLRQRAIEKHAPLQSVGIHPVVSPLKLIPDADYQRQNTSLALVLANTVLQKLGQDAFSFLDGIPSVVREGLEITVWKGRCEIKPHRSGT